MLFNSIPFLIFFPIVVMVYWAIPQSWRRYWLLAASYYFYMCWNARYALLLLLSTAITYVSGRIMFCKGARFRKWVVATSFALNLSILFFFKYFNFVFDTLARFLAKVGVVFLPPQLDILLPVGISFYIFQALSYTMDVYRRQIEPEKNFFTYALFVSFFPQLVAGPIERSSNLLPQLKCPRGGDTLEFTRGFQLMLWGFFEKVVIADTLAGIVDVVYNNYTQMNGLQILGGTVLFAFQIYCDFGGYSHIAIGAAQVLGFRLMDNFRQPYFSTSVKEFWRRWHISLSTWFKDYLYLPLGGNRCGKFRKAANTMIVFLLSGLWHGANWTYVVWGGLNGLFQLTGRKTKHQKNIFKTICAILITFCLVDFTWLFFRASSMTQAVEMMKRLFVLPETFSVKMLLKGMGFTKANLPVVILALLVLFIVDILHEKGIAIRRQIIAVMPVWARWGVYIAACETILLQSFVRFGQPATAFMYFQF